MTYLTRFLRSQLALFRPFMSGLSLASVRSGQEKLGRLMASTHKGDVNYQDFEIGGKECSLIVPKDEVATGIVLYLHGGGYTGGNLRYAKGFGTILAAKCGIRVLCMAYRLAPEAPYPAALNDALDAYGYLISNGYAPSQILLCGESAGGGLIYALCLRLKEKGWTLPAGLIAISPWTDLTASGDSYTENVKKDPSMTAERLKYYADCYAYGAQGSGKNIYPKTNPDPEDDRRIKQDPGMSPLFGDLRRMPPSLIFVGGDEIMLDDSRLMYQKLIEAGCRAELVITSDMWHGYVLYGLKENEGDFDRIRRFVRDRLPNQKKLRWMLLDNAAKIFPAARRRDWSNVFRLSATLTEKVDTEVLRSALDVTVRRFPSIAVRVKTGFFWYYLEEIPGAPTIMEEKPYPLSRMIFDDIRQCAFRVIVYDRRIAVEFFHALTDGNGGLVFLKTLVAEYLYQKYGVKVPQRDGVLDRLEEPDEAEMEDSFFRYAGPRSVGRAESNAFRITGVREPDGFKTNTTFILDSDAVAAEAKRLGVTVTAYFAAALIVAVMRIQEERVRNPKHRKPVKILLPVNLRKLFPSRTLRNFVLYVTPGVDPRLGSYEFEEICRLVFWQMKQQITPKEMAARIAGNVKHEKRMILRIMPLFVKNAALKIGFLLAGERKSCFSFSNLGVVRMPEEFMRYVTRLDFVLGVQASAPYNTSAITYEGKIYFNIIRNIREPVLEGALYKVFRELGLRVIAEGNTRGNAPGEKQGGR